MILVEADNVVTISLRVRDGGENGLDEKHHDENQRGEIGNTTIDGDVETGEQPALGHSLAQIVEETIPSSTAFSDVLQQRLEDEAAGKDWCEDDLEEDTDSLDDRVAAIPEYVSRPLLGEDLLAVHVAHKLLLIELYGES